MTNALPPLLESWQHLQLAATAISDLGHCWWLATLTACSGRRSPSTRDHGMNLTCGSTWLNQKQVASIMYLHSETHSKLWKVWLLLQQALQTLLGCPAEGCACLLSMVCKGAKILLCFPLQVLQTLTDCSKRCRPWWLILHSENRS